MTHATEDGVELFAAESFAHVALPAWIEDAYFPRAFALMLYAAQPELGDPGTGAHARKCVTRIPDFNLLYGPTPPGIGDLREEFWATSSYIH